MPDESCRRCGGKLFEHTKCAHCMRPNGMICGDCALCTAEQFHSICMSAEPGSTSTVHFIKADNCSRIVAMA